MEHSLHVAQSVGALMRDATSRAARCPRLPDSLTEHSLQVAVAPQVVQVVALAAVEWLSTGTLGKVAWLLRRELLTL